MADNLGRRQAGPGTGRLTERRRPPVAPGHRAQGGPAGIAVLCPAFSEAADSGLRPRPSADGYRLLGTPSHAIATSWHQGFTGQGVRPVCVRAAYPGRGSHHSRGSGRRCMPGSRTCPLATSQNGSFVVHGNTRLGSSIDASSVLPHPFCLADTGSRSHRCGSALWSDSGVRAGPSARSA